MDKKKTGTKEWAKKNINIQIGCEHDCLYCYARHRAVERYKYCATHSAWHKPVINQNKVDKGYRTSYGTVMFPSTHDITPLNLSEYLCVLKKLLDAGNHVLIVSKPHLSCIVAICEAYEDYRDQILFRFTIGSTDSDVLAFWDPKAPDFQERISCLTYAYDNGYKTSVSCEPYLDFNVARTYEDCRPYLTDSFWIGKIRMLASRVSLAGVSEENMAKFVDPLIRAQTDTAVKTLYNKLNGLPYVKWKDSIREVVGEQGDMV